MNLELLIVRSDFRRIFWYIIECARPTIKCRTKCDILTCYRNTLTRVPFQRTLKFLAWSALSVWSTEKPLGRSMSKQTTMMTKYLDVLSVKEFMIVLAWSPVANTDQKDIWNSLSRLKWIKRTLFPIRREERMQMKQSVKQVSYHRRNDGDWLSCK